MHIIDLFPEESDVFIKATLAIETTKNQLHKITMHDKNGGTYTYLITSFKNNSKSIPRFIFNTDDYPGIEIIDLR